MQTSPRTIPQELRVRGMKEKMKDRNSKKNISNISVEKTGRAVLQRSYAESREDENNKFKVQSGVLMPPPAEN